LIKLQTNIVAATVLAAILALSVISFAPLKQVSASSDDWNVETGDFYNTQSVPRGLEMDGYGRIDNDMLPLNGPGEGAFPYVAVEYPSVADQFLKLGTNWSAKGSIVRYDGLDNQWRFEQLFYEGDPTCTSANWGALEDCYKFMPRYHFYDYGYDPVNNPTSAPKWKPLLRTWGTVYVSGDGYPTYKPRMTQEFWVDYTGDHTISKYKDVSPDCVGWSTTFNSESEWYDGDCSSQIIRVYNEGDTSLGFGFDPTDFLYIMMLKWHSNEDTMTSSYQETGWDGGGDDIFQEYIRTIVAATETSNSGNCIPAAPCNIENQWVLFGYTP
jgi:hypothetical protein